MFAYDCKYSVKSYAICFPFIVFLRKGCLTILFIKTEITIDNYNITAINRLLIILLLIIKIICKWIVKKWIFEIYAVYNLY